MFGYVRHHKPELKCKDFELYQASYCGLCGSLRQRYGMVAPWFLSYDFTFLALLLEEPSQEINLCKGRCHGNLLRKKPRVPDSQALACCSDFTVILAWYQLQDQIQDKGFWAGLPYRLLSLFLKPSFRKAEKLRPGFSQHCNTQLEALGKLEEENCGVMDQVADCFARLLQEAFPEDTPEEKARCLRLVLYHVGRWIYLLDARDDLEEDRNTGQYNPLLLRYGEEIDQEALDHTLEQSLRLARSGLALLDLGAREALVENILYQGMPGVSLAVAQGAWKKR